MTVLRTTLLVSVAALFAAGCAPDADLDRLQENADAASRSLAPGGSAADADASSVEGEGDPVDCCTADDSQAGQDFMESIFTNRTNIANDVGCSTTGSMMTCCVNPWENIEHPDPIPAGASCFTGP